MEQEQTLVDQEAAVREQEKRRRTWPWIVTAVGIVVLLLVLFFLLRGSSADSTSSGDQTGQTSASISDDSLRAIENKAHAALHSRSSGKAKPVCLAAYIIEASYRNGVLVTVRLNATSADLARTYGPGSAQAITTVCKNAVIAGVKEVSGVQVVDQSGALLGSATR